MPAYEITSPDGRKFRITGDGTKEEALAHFQSQFQATPQLDPSEYDPSSPQFQKKYGPTGGTAQNFLAGAGKGFVDLARGAGQMVGLVSRDDVAKSRELDAPLMKTGAGLAGDIAGSIAGALPTAFIPGANTVAGAGAIGAGLGFLQPSTSTKETLTNTGIGGVAGSGSVLAGRAIGSAYRAGKAAIEPFFSGGQDRIAARTLTEFAGGPEQAAQALQNIGRNASDVLPGVQPTTAELAQNAGLSQLERTMKNNPQLMSAFSDRMTGNRNAILGAMDNIAGDAFEKSAAKAERSAATEALYKTAGEQAVKPDATLEKLLQRPSMKKAWEVASDLAAESGDTIAPDAESISGKTLHYLKMAMDDLSDNPASHGIGGNQVRAITSTKNDLVSWIGKNIPEYDAARTTYSAMSKPINQMEIGQVLRDKLQPALADFGANTRMRPQAFAQALRAGDETAANVLGRSRASINDIMSSDQMAKLNQIGRQLGRRTSADELGKAIGSNTGQNLVSQNFVRQLLGPLGLPQSMTERAASSTLAQSVMRPVQWVGSVGEDQVLKRLAQASLDPQVAQSLLQKGVKPDVLAFLRYQAMFGPVAAQTAVPLNRPN